METNADEVVSYCINQGCSFYATQEFIDNCTRIGDERDQTSRILDSFPQLGSDDEVYIM